MQRKRQQENLQLRRVKRWQLDKSKLLCIDFICYYVMYIKVLGALMPLSLITTNNTDWRMKR